MSEVIEFMRIVQQLCYKPEWSDPVLGRLIDSAIAEFESTRGREHAETLVAKSDGESIVGRVQFHEACESRGWVELNGVRYVPESALARLREPLTEREEWALRETAMAAFDNAQDNVEWYAANEAVVRAFLRIKKVIE